MQNISYLKNFTLTYHLMYINYYLFMLIALSLFNYIKKIEYSLYIIKKGITVCDVRCSNLYFPLYPLENPRKLMKCCAIILEVLILIQVFWHLS